MLTPNLEGSNVGKKLVHFKTVTKIISFLYLTHRNSEFTYKLKYELYKSGMALLSQLVMNGLDISYTHKSSGADRY